MQAACCSRSFGVQVEEEFCFQPVCKMRKPPESFIEITIKYNKNTMNQSCYGLCFFYLYSRMKNSGKRMVNMGRL
jgi:hypothetical protein